jgi:hypothetical protein
MTTRPAEDVKYIFPTVTFDLASGGTYETDDRDALAAAMDHPWLTVEYPAADEAAFTRVSGSVPPQEDRLSSLFKDGSDAFNADKVRETELAKADELVQPVALDSGQDQSEVLVEGGVAETLAVDREVAPDETLVPVNDDAAPAKSSRKKG